MIIKGDYKSKGEYLRLRAYMLNEHILSGLAIDETTFYKNEVYAESSHDGKLYYPIYPLLDKCIQIGYVKRILRRGIIRLSLNYC